MGRTAWNEYEETVFLTCRMCTGYIVKIKIIPRLLLVLYEIENS